MQMPGNRALGKFGSAPTGSGSAFNQIQELKEQLLTMRKSNLMKDDTIAFLQREKESLVREVSLLLLVQILPHQVILVRGLA